MAITKHQLSYYCYYRKHKNGFHLNYYKISGETVCYVRLYVMPDFGHHRYEIAITPFPTFTLFYESLLTLSVV
jgi:hypothetical protein